MSLIADALQKVELDRAEAAALSRGPALPPAEYVRRRKRLQNARSTRALVFNTVGVTAGFALLLGLLFATRTHSGEPAIPATPTVVAHAVDDTPPPAAASASVPPVTPAPPRASSDYALVGMTAMGAQTLLSIARPGSGSVWVPVGKTVGPITAVSYDAASDRAVIRVNGELLTIGLRESSSGAPSPPAE